MELDFADLVLVYAVEVVGLEVEEGYLQFEHRLVALDDTVRVRVSGELFGQPLVL